MSRMFSIGVTGDVMFRERLQTFKTVWPSQQRVLEFLRRCDATFINFEAPLTRAGVPTPKMSNLRADPDVALDLASEFGAAVVGLANNHMLDYGVTGLADTLAALDREAIAHTGAGNDVAEALRPVFRTFGDERVAFLSVATTLPPGSKAAADRPGIAPIRVRSSYEIDALLLAEQPGTAPQVRTTTNAEDLAAVCAAVQRAKAGADRVIVAVHWGVTTRMITPFQGVVADYQPPLGHALIDAGADVVVGHHSHRLDGIEFYGGKPILYGLGNFIFASPSFRWSLETVAVRLEFEDGVIRVRLLPFLLTTKGFPEPVDQVGADRVFDAMASASASFHAHLRREGLEAVVEPDA
jgi:poly-gamma-glutamate capsule biosynthesis protein CapA/YwtB (metallophosphatase superfamily)